MAKPAGDSVAEAPKAGRAGTVAAGGEGRRVDPDGEGRRPGPRGVRPGKEAEASGVKASAFLLRSPVSATSSIYPVPSSQRVVARGGRRGGETRRGNRGGPGRAPSGSHWIGDLTKVPLWLWLESDGDSQWLCLDGADWSGWRRRAARGLHPSMVYGAGAQPWSIPALLVRSVCLPPLCATVHGQQNYEPNSIPAVLHLLFLSSPVYSPANSVACRV
jgi:hypothetical protein